MEAETLAVLEQVRLEAIVLGAQPVGDVCARGDHNHWDHRFGSIQSEPHLARLDGDCIASNLDVRGGPRSPMMRQSTYTMTTSDHRRSVAWCFLQQRPDSFLVGRRCYGATPCVGEPEVFAEYSALCAYYKDSVPSP